jgi:3-oxoacyl-(acyl-carrier-protein) synthase
MKFATPGLFVVGISAVGAFTKSQSSSSRASSVALTQLNAEKKRVVVTGLGVISGCGIGHENFFDNVVNGVSSLGVITRFDPTHYPCKIGSEVPDSMFVPEDHFVNPKNAKSNDRFTHFAVAAARLALKDAKLGDTPETLLNPERCGVFVGSAFGGMETFEREVLKLHSKPDRPKVRDGGGYRVGSSLHHFIARCTVMLWSVIDGGLEYVDPPRAVL